MQPVCHIESKMVPVDVVNISAHHYCNHVAKLLGNPENYEIVLHETRL